MCPCETSTQILCSIWAGRCGHSESRNFSNPGPLNEMNWRDTLVALIVAVTLFVWQCLLQIWSALQCVAVCCSELQCVAVCCSVMQCVAVCCSALQCVAVLQIWRRSTLKTTRERRSMKQSHVQFWGSEVIWMGFRGFYPKERGQMQVNNNRIQAKFGSLQWLNRGFYSIKRMKEFLNLEIL